MKKYRTAIMLLACIGFMLNATSCLVFVDDGHGKTKRGWHKNSNNPHHPNTTNPGHTKGKRK